jgi:proteic killer suppression protein
MWPLARKTLVDPDGDCIHSPGTWLATGRWSLTVQANWRIIFRFDGDDVELLDYLDYH